MTVLDDLVRLCVALSGHGHCGSQAAADQPAPSDQAAPGQAGDPDQAALAGQAAVAGRAASLDPRARRALEQAVIGKAVDLLSGPGGLASFLRTRLAGARLAGPSLPLDVGASRDVPAAIRRAVSVRAGGHCEWAGGCDQPAAACEVHHLTHRADGGGTSVSGCALLCTFHHQVMIHRVGWTVTLNPDGTTTARSPDGSKVLHSHGPPARAG